MCWDDPEIFDFIRLLIRFDVKNFHFRHWFTSAPKLVQASDEFRDIFKLIYPIWDQVPLKLEFVQENIDKVIINDMTNNQLLVMGLISREMK